MVVRRDVTVTQFRYRIVYEDGATNWLPLILPSDMRAEYREFVALPPN
jgi:hypothetical protein